MSIDVKNFFFDRAAVIKAMDQATRKALSKAGAYVRTRAKSSMRRRKGPSSPGQPPSSHSGQLKNLLFYSWDPASKSVVVGPVKFNKGVVPALLEFGGKETVIRRGVSRTVTIDARPYMGPALKAEAAAGTIPSCWESSLQQ